MGSSPFRPAVVVVVTAALVLVGVAGCSGGDPDDRDDALVVGSLALQDWGPGVDRGIRRCFGRSLIDALGFEAALREADPDQQAAELTAEELEIARAAYDECLPPTVFAAGMTSAMLADPGAAPEELDALNDCVAGRVDGRVGEAWVEAAQADGPGPAVTGLVGDCPTDDLVRRLVDDRLAGAGRPPEVRDCAVEAVTGQVTLAELVTDDPVAGVRIETAVADCSPPG